MNLPMIESNDRGITLNKSLAWAVLTGVLAGGIWVGVQVNSAREGIDNLAERQAEDRLDIRSNTESIVSLRTGNARIEQRLTSIESTAQRTESSVSEILRFLRGEAAPERIEGLP